MVRAARQRGGEGQQVAFAPAESHHVCHLGLALGERPRLIKGGHRDLAESFEHGPALEQQPAPCPGRQSGRNRRRRRDHQGAGTADQKDRQALIDPLRPARACEQWRHHGNQSADRDHAWRVVA